MTQQKIWCYNWEYAREEILADSFVSIFSSHNFFIQINYLNWDHPLLALFMKQKRLQNRI